MGAPFLTSAPEVWYNIGAVVFLSLVVRGLCIWPVVLVTLGSLPPLVLVTPEAVFIVFNCKLCYNLCEVVLMKSEFCKQCENYKYAITELRRQAIFKFLKFVAVLAFVAVLCVRFYSYIPCLFLILLLL